MKYKIKVIKIDEKPEEGGFDKLVMKDEGIMTLFQADINADDTIELLHHLHSLKNRRST